MKYTSFFKFKTRECGHGFYLMADNSPQQLKDLVKFIHIKLFDDCLPNEWIFEAIFWAFSKLEVDSLYNITIEADPYHHQLHKWIGEPYALDFYERAIEEGLTDGKDLYKSIACAQYLALMQIYSEVNDFLKQASTCKE